MGRRKQARRRREASNGAGPSLSVLPRQEERGGYDCDFVNPPPDSLQTECPICLHLLKEPCVISCPCGQKICRECIEQIKKQNKPCPLCNKRDFTFMKDYGYERMMNEFYVRCSKKEEGCDWKGKLRDYEQHLNQNPSPQNQLTGCQFVEVKCEHGPCGEWFQRRHIVSHQNKQCRKRPYSCEYCHNCNSTFEDVTVSHYPECKKYPVACPNCCQNSPFERQELELHLKEKCPLAQVKCPLHYAGCEVRLPRKDMPEHMRDTATHMTMLASVTQTLLKENEDLQKDTDDLKRENRQLKVKAQERDAQLSQLRVEVQQLKALKFGFPVEFRVRYIQGNFFLPSFYTHSCGYRICVEVTLNQTSISVFTHLMQGDYDNHLRWPFRGEITIQIVNQAGDHTHIERAIAYTDSTPDDSAGRVLMGFGQQSRGWGYPELLYCCDVGYNILKNTQYMKYEVIILRVTKVSLQ